MNFFEKTSSELAGVLFWFAGAAIVAMMLLTCADVALRYFRMPIPGTYELVSFLGAVGVSFALALTSLQGGHVAVSLVVRLFPRRVQGAVDAVTGLLSWIFFALIAWRSVLYGNTLRETGEVSLTLKLPFYPFVYGVALSAAAVCLVISRQVCKSLTKASGK